jgi:ATP-dependent Lhr-like helicase
MELYAVFSSPQSYTVETADGRGLGSLNQDFVDRLVEGVSGFLLSGRAWTVLRVVHGERRIQVEPAPRGRQPTWGGFLPQFLGFTVCQKMLEVLTTAETYAYLTPAAAEALAHQREAMAEVLTPSLGGIELDTDEVRWWTYAGGAINSTLRQALGAAHADWKVTTDNVLVRVRGEDLDGRTFAEALERLTAPAFWDDQALWQDVAGSLPSYRLSKFQPLMPPWVEREVLGRYLLDVAGTKAWLLAVGRGPGLRP